jgi:lipopolysaccharide/colanic/teichoic acid biosynthesis glycosyltransferase
LIPETQLSDSERFVPVEEESATSRISRQYEHAIKRVIDIIGAVVLLVAMSPLLLGIALLVIALDGVPILYRRRVVGASGEFDAFKFRTMRRDADAILASDPVLQKAFSTNFKLKSDPRVTKLGSLLRKYSLDELPQLVNVLFGQMSLVGPRMVTAAELEKYGKYTDLLRTMKPGITGYWQVHGRQDVSYAERVRMDVEYITHWRVWSDFEILLLTPLRVLSGRGAY